MEDFKGNSNASKIKEQDESQKLAPITSNVIVKKESEMKKFAKQFFKEDSKTVGAHIVSDVVIPGIQKLLSDSIKNGIDWIIYGVSGVSKGSSGVGNVSYSKYYERNRPLTQSSSPAPRMDIYSVSNVVFTDRGEAEDVLLSLREQIERYGMVSVGDFYDLISQKGSYTDNKYGWKDLKEAEVVRARDGYSIKFPKIIPLE